MQPSVTQEHISNLSVTTLSNRIKTPNSSEPIYLARSNPNKGNTPNDNPKNDTLDSTPRHNLVLAGDGDDTVRGGPGNDRLIGGPGSDTYYGGPGADIFVIMPNDTCETFLSMLLFWKEHHHCVDVIQDFQQGIDKIQVTDATIVTWEASTDIITPGGYVTEVSFLGNEGDYVVTVWLLGTYLLSKEDLILNQDDIKFISPSSTELLI